MINPLNFLTRIGDKAGALGAVVSAMGCAMCFPALANIASALGMGFLGQWEGLFINTLFPLFASLTLLVNLLGWFSHRQWYRTLLGITGPIIVLLSLYPWFQYAWSSYATYTGLALMVIFAIWDMISPANRRCDDESCTV
jgi:mercuric ion transport protein